MRNELYRKNPDNVSPFRKIAIDKLPEFTWDKLADDLKSKAPTIFKIFSLVVSHNDHRNEFKKGASCHMPSICMAIAILLKERNREICGFSHSFPLHYMHLRSRKK